MASLLHAVGARFAILTVVLSTTPTRSQAAPECDRFVAEAAFLAATAGTGFAALCETGMVVFDNTAEISPTIVAVDKRSARLPARHPTDPTMPRAWVRSDQPGKIFVATWTDTYKHAAAGDRNAIKELAGLIAHETYHVEHGPDEGGAYQQQIDVLTAVGAARNAVARAREAQRLLAPLYSTRRR